MGIVFHPSTNTIARVTALGLFPAVVFVSWAVWEYQSSQFMTLVGYAREQPAPFSHRHHVAGLGIDCRYCHTSVEVSNTASIPPTQVCMNCHQQVWTNAQVLAPVRQSWADNQPIRWTRVHRVPDYVFFNHSIHINKGMGCETCHGRVDDMPLVWKTQSLHMAWCLECHRNPERFIRPRENVFDMNYQPKEPQSVLGPRLVREYGIRTTGLTDCITCHR